MSKTLDGWLERQRVLRDKSGYDADNDGTVKIRVTATPGVCHAVYEHPSGHGLTLCSKVDGHEDPHENPVARWT
jgi:hypothetical protein